MSDNLPTKVNEPPDMLWTANPDETVGISEWSGGRAIAIGNEAMEEWLTYDGPSVEVLDCR